MKPVRRIAVIGAGAAGRAFALRAAQAGFAVVLEDVMPHKLRRAQDEYAELVSAAGSLDFVSTVEDAVREADLAIDFVPDELESKLEIFSLLDRMAPPHTILCTPTNALSMTDLASCTYRSAQCVGLRGELLSGEVGIVTSRFLSADVAAAVAEFFSVMGVASQIVEDREEPMLVKNVGVVTPNRVD
ncbi:MAG: 3-hydroxyacyl-CoA dehydrogenase NAD-binding domain-containing protein [Acidobacteriota bacterium]